MQATSRKLERWELVSFRSLFLCLRGLPSSRTLQMKSWRSPFRFTLRKRSFESGLTNILYSVRRRQPDPERHLITVGRIDHSLTRELALWRRNQGASGVA